MDTNLEIINQTKWKKYIYGELYVFSIFDFMGKLFLSKMAENKGLEYPREKDITIEEVSIDDLYFHGLQNLNTRNWTIEGGDREATFVVKYKRRELLLKQIIKIVQGTKINNIARRIEFSALGVVIMAKIRTRVYSDNIEYEGPFLDGHIWVNHLEATGFPREKAVQLVETLVEMYTETLNNRHEK